MKKIKLSLILSIFTGLFLAHNFFMVFIWYSTPEIRLVSLGSKLREYFEILLLFFSIGFLISVFFVICIGFSLYWIGRKYFSLSYFNCALGGISITIFPYLLCILSGWNIPDLTTISGFIIFSIIVSCGVFGGITFMALERYWCSK